METIKLTLKEAKELAKKQYILLTNRWKNRRRMAYIALFSIIVVTFLLLYHISPEKIKVLENIITWFYITMGSIIGAYVGFSTLDHRWQKLDKNKDDLNIEDL
jgi:polyferredoxin